MSKPLTEEWLASQGFRDDGLKGWTKLIPPPESNDDSAIVEMHVEPWDEGFTVSLTQDDRDHVTLTSLTMELTEEHILLLLMAFGVGINSEHHLLHDQRVDVFPAGLPAGSSRGRGHRAVLPGEAVSKLTLGPLNAGGERTVMCGGHLVATFHHECVKALEVEMEKYAVLFVAAPGLLAACQKVIEELRPFNIEENGMCWEDCIAPVRAAIAKAKP